MPLPFNLAFIRGATNEQLKNSMVYKPYLKTDDEIEGYKTKNDVFEPVLISVKTIDTVDSVNSIDSVNSVNEN
jgi:predicted tellurium resistance membrane protein TerC